MFTVKSKLCRESNENPRSEASCNTSMIRFPGPNIISARRLRICFTSLLLAGKIFPKRQPWTLEDTLLVQPWRQGCLGKQFNIIIIVDHKL